MNLNIGFYIALCLLAIVAVLAITGHIDAGFNFRIN